MSEMRGSVQGSSNAGAQNSSGAMLDNAKWRKQSCNGRLRQCDRWSKGEDGDESVAGREGAKRCDNHTLVQMCKKNAKSVKNAKSAKCEKCETQNVQSAKCAKCAECEMCEMQNV